MYRIPDEVLVTLSPSPLKFCTPIGTRSTELLALPKYQGKSTIDLVIEARLKYRGLHVDDRATAIALLES